MKSVVKTTNKGVETNGEESFIIEVNVPFVLKPLLT